MRHAAPAEFRRENAALRSAARALASERDRQATCEALDKLLAHAECEWGDSVSRLRTLRQLRDTIVDSHRQDSSAAHEDMLRHVTEELRTGLARLKHWTAAADDERIVISGFADSYRRARRALRAVLADPTGGRLHEWRKQIKYHRYQVRLFQHAWPAMLEVHCEELKRLTDLLGDDHDLVLVRQTLEEPAGKRRQEAIGELLELLERRRCELQAEAIPLGRLLFAEKPKRLTRRFKQYWCVYFDGDHH